MQHKCNKNYIKSYVLSYRPQVLDDKVKSKHKLNAIDSKIQHRIVLNGVITGRKDILFDDLDVNTGAYHAFHFYCCQQHEVKGHESLPSHELDVVEGCEVGSQKTNQTLYVAFDQEEVAEIHADVCHWSIQTCVLSTEHSKVKWVDSYRQLQQKQLQENQKLQKNTLPFLTLLCKTFLMRVDQLRYVNSIVGIQAFILSYIQKLLSSIMMMVQLRSNQFQGYSVQPNPIQPDILPTKWTPKIPSDRLKALPTDTMILRAYKKRFVVSQVILIVTDVAVALRGGIGRVRSEIWLHSIIILRII